LERRTSDNISVAHPSVRHGSDDAVVGIQKSGITVAEQLYNQCILIVRWTCPQVDYSVKIVLV
jgi:hypothetical protein